MKKIRRKPSLNRMKAFVGRKSFFPSLIAVLLILFLRLGISFLSEENEPKTPHARFKGVIDFWDTSARTVKGNEYSFINTVLADFCESYTSLRIDLNRISRLTPEETSANAFGAEAHPDVMRSKIGSFEASFEGCLRDEAAAKELSGLYAPYIIPSYGDAVAVDMYANASVILVNSEILSELGVANNIYDGSPDSFISLLSEIRAKDADNAYIAFDYCAEDIYSFLPFLLHNGIENADGSYLQILNGYLPSDTSVRSADTVRNDFYGKKTAVCVLSLSEVNYLLRRQMNQKGFAFQIYIFPHSGKEFVFIREITSYVFYDSGKENKNEVLKELALYMLSDASQKYTENIGMLPCGKVKLAYETYPHLKSLTKKETVYYTCRDGAVKSLYEKIKEEGIK